MWIRHCCILATITDRFSIVQSIVSILWYLCSFSCILDYFLLWENKEYGAIRLTPVYLWLCPFWWFLALIYFISFSFHNSIIIKRWRSNKISLLLYNELACSNETTSYTYTYVLNIFVVALRSDWALHDAMWQVGLRCVLLDVILLVLFISLRRPFPVQTLRHQYGCHVIRKKAKCKVYHCITEIISYFLHVTIYRHFTAIVLTVLNLQHLRHKSVNTNFHLLPFSCSLTSPEVVFWSLDIPFGFFTRFHTVFMTIISCCGQIKWLFGLLVPAMGR